MHTFTKSEPAYLEVAHSVKAVFDISVRFPEFVFRRKPYRLAFFEFDDLFEDFFWHSVQALASECHESKINLLVVDPDPEAYFRRYFGFYGAAQLSATIEAAVYQQLLSSAPPESPADSLVDNGRILAFAGSGQGFGFWCERDLEIGVVGVFERGPSGLVPALPPTMNWKSAEEAIALMAPAFLDRKTPREIAGALRANYAT